MNQNVFNANSLHHMVASNGSAQHSEACCASPGYREASISRETFMFPPIHPAFGTGIESYLDPKYATDPIAFASRLPYLPFRASYGMYEFGFEPAFIRKRNERERQRVKCVNEGYAKLRDHLPQEFAEKRLSKVETLRGAIQYIKHLQGLLGIERKVEKLLQQKNDRKKCESPSNLDNGKDVEDAEEESIDDKELIETTDVSKKKDNPELFQNEESSVLNDDGEKTNSSPLTKIKLEAPSPTSPIQDNASIVPGTMVISQRQSSHSFKNRYSTVPLVTKTSTPYSGSKFHDNMENEYFSCSYGKRNGYSIREFKRARINSSQTFQPQLPYYNSNNSQKCSLHDTCDTSMQVLYNTNCCAYNSAQDADCSMNFPRSDGIPQYDSVMQNRCDFISSYYYQHSQPSDKLSVSSHVLDNSGGFNVFRHFASSRGCHEHGRMEGDSDGFKSDSSPCSNGMATSP